MTYLFKDSYKEIILRNCKEVGYVFRAQGPGKPRGSEYPNSKLLRDKIHTLSGFLDRENRLFE